MPGMLLPTSIVVSSGILKIHTAAASSFVDMHRKKAGITAGQSPDIRHHQRPYRNPIEFHKTPQRPFPRHKGHRFQSIRLNHHVPSPRDILCSGQ